MKAKNYFSIHKNKKAKTIYIPKSLKRFKGFSLDKENDLILFFRDAKGNPHLCAQFV